MKRNFQNIFLYVKHFRDLISIEREEEIKFHTQEIRKFSPKKREEVGRAILGIFGKFEGKGLGNTFVMKYSREGHGRLPDTEIGVGSLVIVTSKNKPDGNELQGTVMEKNSHSILVAYPKRPSQYHFKGNLRMDLFANDITYYRMLVALKRLVRKTDIHRILLKRMNYEEEFIDEINFFNENLDFSQREAVVKSFNAKNFFLLHGPPGTGKTTTLVESILQHAVYDKKILVCADSNVAVDNIVSKLAKHQINLVRIGNPVRMSKDVLESSLDFIVEKNSYYRDAQGLMNEVELLRKEQDEKGIYPSKEMRGNLRDKQIKRLAKKRKSVGGVPAPVIRKMAIWIKAQNEIKELTRKAKILEAEAVLSVLKKAQVICTTNIGAGGEVMDDFIRKSGTVFDVLFIDEATQATEPSCLVPMILSKKFIFAGDHKQLPPTVLSKDARDLEFSLFERLIDKYEKTASSILKVQYRMHEDIMNFPNELMYEGKLLAHKSVAHHTLDDFYKDDFIGDVMRWEEMTLESKRPLVFLDTSKSFGFENRKEGSTSVENSIEARVVKSVVEKLMKKGLRESDIGVITPYDDQVNLLREGLNEFEDIEVKSVDGFQGREKEVIIISFVRANETGEIGFLKDLRRLNVAITRARRKLIMIGHRNTLDRNDTYKKMIEGCGSIVLES